MKLAAVLAALALSSSVAHADAKSKTTALALAGVGTGVSAGLLLTSYLLADDSQLPVNTPLFVAGMVTSTVTPSLGQMYAGQYLTIGMGVRAASMGLAGLAVYGMTETRRCNLTEECVGLTQEAVVVIGLAAIAYIGGTAYDIVATSDAVTRYNNKHSVILNIAAAPLRASDGSLAPGIGLSGTF